MADEKIYTIPLREAYKKARQNRVPYASRLVESFIRTHTKAESVKMGSHLTEELWKRGIEKPPRKIRVKSVVSDGIAKIELMGHDYAEFKAAPKKESKDMKEKLMERMGQKAAKKEEMEKSIEGKKEKEQEEKIDKSLIEKQIEKDKTDRKAEKQV